MTQATKTSRKSRASATRKKVWDPTSMDRLNVPKEHKQADMEYIWVRHELLNNPDDSNVHERLREGYVTVKPDELGDDYHADVMTTGKHAGTVRSGDLILMKHTNEYVAEKEAYFDAQSERMGKAYTKEYQNASSSAMPTTDDSSSTVTRGGGKGTPKFEE